MKFLNFRFAVLGVVVILTVAFALTLGLDQRSSPETVDVVTLARQVRAGEVAAIIEEKNGREATVEYTDPSAAERRVNIPAGTDLITLFDQAGVPWDQMPSIDLSEPSAVSQMSPFLRIFIVIAIFAGVLLFIRKGQAGFSKSGTRKGAFDPIRPEEQAVLLSDVAGIEEVKEEIGDVIDFLREPEKFHKLGARIPRGALLVGPPGTGKTLLARAVAGEARASFFSVSGSEFVELYVGVGASRVRELFKRARECAPSIIFIDEIDSIGRKRGRAEHSTEYDQTLNQILVEMDGFDQRQTVVVMAATNRIDILDPALLRPGRFDRKIHVDLPDRAARAAILRVHARSKPLAAGVDLDELAARTTGMSGADLANLMNEAAILAARRNADVIDMSMMAEAMDRTLAGAARKAGRFSQREREIIAYHEAGHALVAHFLPNADPVRKVSIVSRGRAGGYTMIVPDEDRGLWTRGQLTDRLAALLGGYAAEDLVFGDVTTGSSNDLEQVSSITLSMVARYGMGQTFGLLSSGVEAGASNFSQRTAFAAESEARSIVDAARNLAYGVLHQHQDDLERLANRLLEVETIDAPELTEMFGPAVTAGPRPKRPAMPIQALPPRTVHAPQPARRPSRLERLVSAPAAIVAGARVGPRRQPSE